MGNDVIDIISRDLDLFLLLFRTAHFFKSNYTTTATISNYLRIS